VSCPGEACQWEASRSRWRSHHLPLLRSCRTGPWGSFESWSSCCPRRSLSWLGSSLRCAPPSFASLSMYDIKVGDLRSRPGQSNPWLASNPDFRKKGSRGRAGNLVAPSEDS
jgi:hypothetical protein